MWQASQLFLAAAIEWLDFQISHQSRVPDRIARRSGVE